jgi:hypothetical protein
MESGKSAELQAIKDAAYCSTLTLNDVVSLRKNFLAKRGEEKTEDEIKVEILEEFMINAERKDFGEKPLTRTQEKTN